MPALNPYLNFNGKTEEAFNFYKSVFGGEFATVSRFKDIPAEYKSSDKEDNLILHIALPIQGGSVLMGSDVPGHMPPAVTGSNMHISIHPETKGEADTLFAGLSAGGNVFMPMADAFWGSYFGMLIDKYGIHWMINVDTNGK